MGHRATPTAIEVVSRRAGVAFIEQKGRASGGRSGVIMTSNHHVMKPNRVAGLLEICTNLAVMGCSSFAKWEYVQACSKPLDDLDVFDLPCRFLGTVDDLGESHGGDTKLIRKRAEPLAQPFGRFL